MIRAVAIAALLVMSCQDEECPNGRRWSPEPEREDLRACNMARAGEGHGGWRFYDCMHSLGYARVCQ